MGHTYTFDGSIKIEPALNFSEIKKAREIALAMLRENWDRKNATEENVFEGYMPLKPGIVESTEDSDRGTLMVKEAPSLVPSHENEGSISFSMDNLVEALVHGLPGHTWSGTVTAIDDEYTSAYKLVVEVSSYDHKQGKTRSIKQINGSSFIHWEDGTESSVASIT